MRFAPAPIFSDMFIWVNAAGDESFEAFVNFGAIPDPEKLLYREKISLPSTKFDHEYSATECPNDSNKDCSGNPYGIHINAKELNLCRVQSKICIIFFGIRHLTIETETQVCIQSF